MANHRQAVRFIGHILSVLVLLALGCFAASEQPATAWAQHDRPRAGDDRLTRATEPAVSLPRTTGPAVLTSSGQSSAIAPNTQASLDAAPVRHAPDVVAPPPALKHDKVIYLTFDDGPSVPWTREVLAVLARYHAHATFFVVGQNAKAHSDLIRAIAAGGHAIGNHSYDHPWLGHLNRDEVMQELQQTQKALGAFAADCMRPPFGSTNAHTRSYAAQAGLKLLLWDVDPRDWSRPGVSTIESFVIRHAYPGATILLHDGYTNRSQTVAALSVILKVLSQQGYRFETEPACRHTS